MTAQHIVHSQDSGTDRGCAYDRKRRAERICNLVKPNPKPRTAIVSSAIMADLAAVAVDVDFIPLYLLDKVTDEVTTLVAQPTVDEPKLFWSSEHPKAKAEEIAKMVAQQLEDDTDFAVPESNPKLSVLYGSLIDGSELGFAQCALKHIGHLADSDEDNLDGDVCDRPMDGYRVRRYGW